MSTPVLGALKGLAPDAIASIVQYCRHSSKKQIWDEAIIFATSIDASVSALPQNVTNPLIIVRPSWQSMESTHLVVLAMLQVYRGRLKYIRTKVTVPYSEVHETGTVTEGDWCSVKYRLDFP